MREAETPQARAGEGSDPVRLAAFEVLPRAGRNGATAAPTPFRFIRSSVWALAGYLASTGSAFAVSIVIARTLGPASFGAYAYYLWVLRLVPGLLALGIPYALSKHVSERLGAGDSAGARGLVTLALRAHLLLIGLPVLAAGLMAWVRDRDAGLAFAVAAAAGAAVIALDYDGVVSGLRRFDLLTKLGGAVAVAQVGLAAVGVALGIGARGFILMQGVGLMVNAVLLWAAARHLLRDRPPRPIARAERRGFLRFAGIMAVGLALDALLFGRPEVFFLDLWRTEAEVGLYSSALRVWALTVILPTVMGKVLLPEFASLVGAGRLTELRGLYPKVCKVIAFVSIPMALGGAVVAGSLVQAFFGPRFAGAAGPAAILIGASFVSAVSAPLTTAILTGPRPKLIIEVGVGVVALNLVLDVVLIPRHGMAGAAWATVVSQLVAVCIGAGIAWARYGFAYPLADIGRLLGVGALSAATAALTLRVGSGLPALCAAVFVGGLVYFAAARLSGSISLAELREVWHGGRYARVGEATP